MQFADVLQVTHGNRGYDNPCGAAHPTSVGLYDVR